MLGPRITALRVDQRVVLALIVLAGLVLRLILAWQDIESLAISVTPDDTYYYLQVARTIVEGNGPSLDGINITNGFHPLWLALLLPFAKLGDSAFVHTATTLGAIIDTAAIVALWWALAPLTKRVLVRAIAVSFYAFSPPIIFSAASGMETGLSLLLLILLFGLLLRSRERDPADYGYWVLFGVVSGLVVLARTDSGIIVAVLLLFMAVQRVRDLRPILLAGACAGAVTLPWFVWNIATFGTPVQGSGEAMSLWRHGGLYPMGTGSLSNTLSASWNQLSFAFRNEVPNTYFFSKHYLTALVGVWAAGTLIAAKQSANARLAIQKHLFLLLAPAVGLALLISFHAGVRWFLRPWYFAVAIPIVSLYLASGLDVILTWLAEQRQRGRQLQYVVVPILLGVMITTMYGMADKGMDKWRPGFQPWGPDMLAGARWINEETPEDTTVAGLNVGFLSYFGHRPTINLDGVVNDGALDALRKRELLAYVQAQGPTYIVEYDLYLFNFYRVFWGADLQPYLRLEQEFRDAVQGFPYRVYSFDSDQ